MSAEPMSEKEIREALARCEKATPGPWGIFSGEDVAGIHHPAWVGYPPQLREVHKKAVGVLCWANDEETTAPGQPYRDVVFRGGEDDERFIAHAREDLPRALATIQSQAARIAALTEALAEAVKQRGFGESRIAGAHPASEAVKP